MRIALTLIASLASGAALAVMPQDPRDDHAAVEATLARLPGDPDLLTYLALALRRTGRFAEAEARYEEALSRDAAHLPAIAYQGVLYLETGRRAMAEANLRRLEALCPQGCAEREDLAREVAARR